MQPCMSSTAAHIYAVGLVHAPRRQTSINTLELEVGGALRSELGQTAADDRRLSAGYGVVSVAPEAQRIAPPPSVFEVATAVWIEDARKYLAVRSGQCVKLGEEGCQVAHQA